MRPQEEIETEDITFLFYDEINKILEHKELINIQIIGEVTSGKSAVMAHLVNYINERMDVRMDLNKIMADQIEFREYIQQKHPKNICIGIDEWNEMGTQGMNATTEEKFLTWVSDVMAQKYVHRISCSPETQVDKRANILLEILGKDVEKGLTRCIVKYRIVRTEMIKPQTVGYVDIPVKDILNKDWYNRYRTRKMAKMDLVTQKGISDPRKIEQAGLILQTYEKLKDTARITNIDTGLIGLTIDEIITNNAMYLSIITTSEMEKRILGLLKAETKIAQLENKAIQYKRKNDWPKAKEVEKAKEMIEAQIQRAVAQQKKLQEIYKEYRAI